MARGGCGCPGGSCGCLVRARLIGGDPGIVVTGRGTATDPYELFVAPRATGVVTVTNTDTVTMSRSGSGTTLSPYVISAAVRWVLPLYTPTTRPSAAGAGAGAMYFNTLTNKPNWSTGADWIEADGTVV